MVIDSIFAHHLLDPDLIVEIFFKKKGAVEYECADFEMVDLGTSAHVCWRFKKVSCRTCLLMYCFLFLVTKKVLKALLTCIFIAALLNSFDSPSYSSEWRRRYILRLFAVDVSRSAGGRFFLFFWERLKGSLVGTYFI